MINIISKQKQLFTPFNYVTFNTLIDWLDKNKIIGIDSETEGFDPYTCKDVCWQIGNAEEQFIIDTSSGETLELIKEVFTNPEWLKLGQNLKFDIRFLLHKGIEVENIYDTFLVECILTTGLSNRSLGLDALAMKYCGKFLDKSVRGEINYKGLTERVIKYAAEDVVCLHEIREKQLQEVEKLKLHRIVDLENQVSIAFARMEYNGLYLDKEEWLKLAEKAALDMKKYERELDAEVLQIPSLKKYCQSYQMDLFSAEFEKYSSIKWSSPLQIKEVFKELGIDDIESTSEKDINKYSKQYPLVNKFIEYKKKSKLVTTYGKKFLNNINPVSKKVHTSVWQILETGRISTGGHESPNMQNIPAKNEYLNCFKAGEGKVLVASDYSAQELRLIAEFSQDPIWVNAFREGKDLHGELAALTFGVPIEEVRNKPEFLRGKSYRDVQKTINFGLAFGMTEFKLSKTLDIPVEDAKKFIDKYFSVVPSVEVFLKTLSYLASSRGFIKTYLGRIRFFDDISYLKEQDWREWSKRNGEIERAGKNTPIQGSAADMAKQAILNCEYSAKKLKYPKFVLQIHDCLVYEVPEEKAEEWKEIQEAAMIRAGGTIIKSIPIEVDTTITKEWTK
jgi:DNA polymerase-1